VRTVHGAFFRRNGSGGKALTRCRAGHKPVENIVVDQEVLESQIKVDRFPFPSEGDITLAVRNASYALGPVMLHLVMKPGAVVPKHLHKGMAEALYIVEGDFTNEGKQYQAGTSLHFKAGNVHRTPHNQEWMQTTHSLDRTYVEGGR
jgi:hypothetical protein